MTSSTKRVKYKEKPASKPSFKISFNPSPRFWASAIAFLYLAFAVFVLSMAVNIVTVTDSTGARRLLVTSERKPEALMRLSGISAEEYDDVFYTDYNGPVATLHIQRAFPVEVTVDGQTHTAHISAGSTETVLSRLDIDLSSTDYCIPSLNTPLEEGDSVRVYRVIYQDTITEENVPSPITYQYSSLVRGSRTYVLHEGAPGTNLVTYRERIVDGEFESAQVVNVEQTLAPTETVVLARQAGVPVSPLEGPAIVNGAPASYSYVITDAIATGYSSRGGRGSSRLGLYYGTVAVNPNVIPYGTRMYIVSTDGSFIYGYAIATDTGIALMEGIIDVDLYYETYLESVLNGRRIVNIYIL